MTAPISACIIVKNDPIGLEKMLASVRPHVAEIVVVDTGSSDNTPDVAKRFADKFEVYTGCNNRDGLIEDFSNARQRSFDLATQPVALWIDSDDELIGGENLARLVKPHTRYSSDNRPHMIIARYDYAQDDNGHSICEHWRERLIVNPARFVWRSPIHEVCAPRESASHSITDAFHIKHHRQRIQKPGEPGRNLRIIRNWMAKHGDSDVRLCYYRGLEEFNAGNFRDALRWHKLYVQRSGWDDEKALAALECAKIHQHFEEYDIAIEWALKAIAIRETWQEPYFSLARSHYAIAQRGDSDAQRNWERCANFARQGLALPPTRSILWVDPTDRAHGIHAVLNVALAKLGDVQGALDSCRTALAFAPSADMTVNAEQYETVLAHRAIESGTGTLVRLGKLDPAAAKAARSIIDGHYTLRRPRQGAKDIVFFLGHAWERWNPETLAAGGMGGSETMAVEMAKRLAARGHRVRVYGDCAELEGVFDGVQYLDYPKFHNVRCDVLVSSRRPDAVDAVHDCTAARRVLWVHDVHCGDALTPERAAAFDRILVLSQWHRDHVREVYPWLDERKLYVTRNAVDLTRFDGTEERNPHRAIYSSSPDRGLLSLLQMWPRIREQVPDAELHVFYGFKNWEGAVEQRGDAREREHLAEVKRLLEAMRELGVTMRDRVSGKQLAREFMKSGVWLYPTWFTETYCITAAEAQIAGCRIVTSPIAALVETCGAGTTWFIAGDWLSDEYQLDFERHAVTAMNQGDGGGITFALSRDESAAKARERFSFDSLVDAWEREVL